MSIESNESTTELSTPASVDISPQIQLLFFLATLSASGVRIRASGAIRARSTKREESCGDSVENKKKSRDNFKYISSIIRRSCLSRRAAHNRSTTRSGEDEMHVQKKMQISSGTRAVARSFVTAPERAATWGRVGKRDLIFRGIQSRRRSLFASYRVPARFKMALEQAEAQRIMTHMYARLLPRFPLLPIPHRESRMANQGLR